MSGNKEADHMANVGKIQGTGSDLSLESNPKQAIKSKAIQGQYSEGTSVGPGHIQENDENQK